MWVVVVIIGFPSTVSLSTISSSAQWTLLASSDDGREEGGGINVGLATCVVIYLTARYPLERLSSLRRLKCTSIIEKGSQTVSFTQVSIIQSVHYQRFCIPGMEKQNLTSS